MKFQLPAHNLYGNEAIELNIPDNWDVQVCTYRGASAPALSYEELKSLICSPKGGRPISQDAKGCKDAVIIFDDQTRPTPIGDVAKIVIEELEKAGLARNSIRFVAATGMHRAMSRDELVRKLGEDIVNEFRIYSHNPFFNNMLVGISREGIPVELNAECVNADYKIGIGAIFPHPNTGIGGAGKLIVPGIASAETIRRYHTQAADRWSLKAKGRSITVDGAKLLGLNYKLDALLNGQGQIAKLYMGDCADNIEKNIGEIKSFFSTPRPESADVVLANNYFKPTEAGVAVCYPEFYSLLNEGGTLIVAAHTPQGAATHYLFGKWGDCGIGGLAYTGDGKIPAKLSAYYAFSEVFDKATGLQYHFDSTDERFHWVHTWEEILRDLGEEKRSLLILPYATTPYFEPGLDEYLGPILSVGKNRYKPI